MDLTTTTPCIEIEAEPLAAGRAEMQPEAAPGEDEHIL